jgi:hypothetical protein
MRRLFQPFCFVSRRIEGVAAVQERGARLARWPARSNRAARQIKLCWLPDEPGNRGFAASLGRQQRRIEMTKTLLALGAAAVALTGVAATTSADAKPKHHARTCAKWRHHHCVSYGYGRHAYWNTGYRFGPRYAYTSYRALPRVYVQRYDLSPNYRYVYRGNYIYQVDPRTYAITRVIDALTR